MSKYNKEYQRQYRARNREIIKANRKQYFTECRSINKQTIKIKGSIRYVQLLISENNNPLINLCEFILLNKGI